jgi:hypothetical protein
MASSFAFLTNPTLVNATTSSAGMASSDFLRGRRLMPLGKITNEIWMLQHVSDDVGEGTHRADVAQYGPVTDEGEFVIAYQMMKLAYAPPSSYLKIGIAFIQAFQFDCGRFRFWKIF